MTLPNLSYCHNHLYHWYHSPELLPLLCSLGSTINQFYLLDKSNKTSNLYKYAHIVHTGCPTYAISICERHILLSKTKLFPTNQALEYHRKYFGSYKIQVVPKTESCGFESYLKKGCVVYNLFCKSYILQLLFCCYPYPFQNSGYKCKSFTF